MTTQPGFLGLLLLQSLVLCAVLVALCDLVQRWLKLDRALTLCAAMVSFGVLGYAAFWLAWVSYGVFAPLKIAVLAALVIHAGWIAYRGELSRHRWLAEPLAFAVLFLIAIVALGFSNGGIGDPAATAQNRFVQGLPPDNILPFTLAEQLKAGRVLSPMIGDWLASDRPPLQAGLYLLLGVKLGEQGYQVVASFVQATFLVGVWVFAMMAGLNMAARRLVLLACCLLPTTILNTFYVWPKVVTTGYLMMTFALLFCFRPKDAREQTIGGILLGGAAALAMLGHGGSMFALIGIAIMVVIAWQWPPWRTVLAGIPVLVALYMPWLAYQALVDPPGNRLLKWHLAGILPVDPRGFGETLRESYGALTWQAYVQGRLENLWAIVGPWPRHLPDLGIYVFSPNAEAGKALRIVDFFNLLPSLHVFALAIVAALLMLPFMRGEWRAQARIATCLFGTALITCAVYGVLLFIPGSAVNHQGTYAVHVMATVAAMMVLASRLPALAIAFVALQAVTVSALYGFTLPHDPRLWPTLAVCIAATVALFAYALAPGFRRAEGVTG